MAGKVARAYNGVARTWNVLLGLLVVVGSFIVIFGPSTAESPSRWAGLIGIAFGGWLLYRNLPRRSARRAP
ncbi:hypothetical protein ACI8AK_02540 [Geodermatophilus sp. SYSU D00867]